MDQRSFDRLARILGEATDRRAGLKAALGALLGAGGAAAMLHGEAEAKKKRRGKAAAPEAGKRKRKKTCKPACGSGFDCVKVGKTRACACATEVICGEACCRVGQVCEGGACVPEPEPAQCIPAGEPCKAAGRACCDDRVCASGQAGLDDVGCYRPKTGACATTADCVYGTRCEAGRCAGLPQPLPETGCRSAAECPAPSDTCKEAACVAGACQVVGKADGASCATGRCSSGACTGCATDAQCAGEAIAKVCNTETNACVQCVTDTSCGGSTPYCSSQSGTCVQCVSANNCGGSTPYCSSQSNTCVECVTASNCGGGTPFCVGNVCAGTCSEIRTTSPGSFSFPNGIAVGGDYVWVTNTRGPNPGDAPWVTKLDRTTGAVVSEGKTGWEGNQYLQGLAVGTDGVPLAVDYTDAASLPYAIYKVNPDGSRGDLWYSFGRDAARRPYGISIDGTATNGTVWVTADSTRKLMKLTAAAGVVTLAETFDDVCLTGNARQVAMSGRTGDPYVYVACETDGVVSVIDPVSGVKVKQITGATKVIGLAFDGPTNTMFTGNSAYPTGGGTVRTWSLSGVGGSLAATSGCLSPQLATNPFITMLAGNGDGTQVWASVFDPGKVVKVAFAAS